MTKSNQSALNPWTCYYTVYTTDNSKKQFHFYWQLGPTNHAGYWKKHHPTTHHKNVRPEFMTPIKFLDTLIKRKLITQNAQKAYLVYIVHKKTNKYQWTSASLCISDLTNTKQSKARTHLTKTKQSKVYTQSHGSSQVKYRRSSPSHKAISQRKLCQYNKASN